MAAVQADYRKRGVFIALVALLALAMPNLNLGMSIAMILLFGYSFYYPGFRAFAHIKSNIPALLLIGLFLLHFIWLFNTTDLAYAWHDIRIKLPLLFLPLILGIHTFNRQEIKLIFLVLSVGIWIASAFAYYNFYFNHTTDSDFREIVQGISPIRLALMMSVLAAGIVAFWKELQMGWKIYSVICLVNTLCIYNLIQSATGVVALGVVMLVSIIYILKSQQRRALNWIAIGFGLALISGMGLFTYSSYNKSFTSKQSVNDLPLYTAKGNEYQHNPTIGIVENGDYTFNYICIPELIDAWNVRSSISIPDGHDKLIGTLIRYLSSKGLTKDYEGVMRLTEDDITHIEEGVPSIIYLQKWGLELRFHILLMGYHHYTKTGNSSGYSFYQRITYWTMAGKIIAKNIWLGVGTGDVKQAFADAYLAYQPELSAEFQHRAHNQFLTFFVSFGILGFLYFIALSFISLRNASYNQLALTIMLILFLSCLAEDTLESQAGVTFFSFFFSLFSRPIDNRESPH